MNGPVLSSSKTYRCILFLVGFVCLAALGAGGCRRAAKESAGASGIQRESGVPAAHKMESTLGSQPPGTPAVDTNPPVLGPPTGAYRAPDGTAVQLYQADADRWVMNFQEPGTTPYTVYLEGGADAMRPVGLAVQRDFRGAPLTVSGDLRSLRNSTLVKGRKIECVHDLTSGKAEILIDGQPAGAAASAEEVELRILAADFAQTWDKLQRAKVELADCRLTIHPYVPPQMKALRKTPPQALNRRGDLADKTKSKMKLVSAARWIKTPAEEDQAP
jgi:hypothetical protein